MALCLLSESAVADYFCVKGHPWTCLGSIEVSFVGFRKTEKIGTIGVKIFDNGDVLAEASGGDLPSSRQILILGPPPMRTFYNGVPDEELRDGNPFAFFDYGFAAPIQALESAYPGGPSSVPEKETETKVVLDPSFEGTLTSSRTPEGAIQYKIAIQAGIMRGVIDFSKPVALPDNRDFTNWKNRKLKSYATIGEARASERVK